MSAIQQLLTEHLDIWTAADTGPKSGRGRSSGNAASVYGIRKLRELIRTVSPETMAQKMGIAYGDNHEHDSKSQVGLR